MLSRILGPLSVLCLGVVVLFLFFAALGAITLSDMAVPLIIVGVLGLLFAAHTLYVRRKLGEHGNQEMLRSVNSLRERRGF